MGSKLAAQKHSSSTKEDYSNAYDDDGRLNVNNTDIYNKSYQGKHQVNKNNAALLEHRSAKSGSSGSSSSFHWATKLNPLTKASNNKSQQSKHHKQHKTGQVFHLSDADIRRLVAETHFNEQEVRKWYREFLNDCPNCQLTKSDFADVYKAMSGNEDGSRYIFAAFDIDHNGKIDFEEFLKAISVTTRGSYNEKLELVFRMYDINNDGTLERKELQQILAALFSVSISLEQLNQMFETLDVNKDNRVTKNEFMRVCSRSDEIRNVLDDNYATVEAEF